MSEQASLQRPKGRRPVNPRRTFTIAEQLRGKLGPAAADELVTRMHSAAKPKRRKRGRR